MRFSPHLFLGLSFLTHTSPSLIPLSRHSRASASLFWTSSQSSSQLRVHNRPDSVVFSPVFLAPRVLYKAPHFISDPRPPKRSKGSNEKREVLDSGDDVWSRTGASPEGTEGEEEKWKSTPQWVAVTRSVRGGLSTPWIKAWPSSPYKPFRNFKKKKSFRNFKKPKTKQKKTACFFNCKFHLVFPLYPTPASMSQSGLAAKVFMNWPRCSYSLK